MVFAVQNSSGLNSKSLFSSSAPSTQYQLQEQVLKNDAWVCSLANKFISHR
jgi:hypothetical protein